MPPLFPVFRFQSHLSLNETVARARAFAAAVNPAQLPPPDDSTPPLGAALTSEEKAFSSTAPVANFRPKRAAPEKNVVTTKAAQTKTKPAAPAERPPVPEPAGVSALPLERANANGPSVAPVVPAADHVASLAGDEEPIEITPEEKDALTKLISQAALVDGFKGRGYVRAWLQKHYQIDVSDVVGIPREIRAQVRAHALSVLESQELGAPQKTPAPTIPLQAPAPPTPPAAADQPATPNQLKELRAAFADLDYAPQQIAEMIRQYRPELAQPSLEDLTSAQAHALLDGLRAAGLRAS